MKRFNQMFRDSERIKLPNNLWQEIEAKVELRMDLCSDRKRSEPIRVWQRTLFRLAASLAMGAGLLIFSRHLNSPSETSRAVNSQAVSLNELEANVEPEMNIMDSELWVWEADLGVDDLPTEDLEEEIL